MAKRRGFFFMNKKIEEFSIQLEEELKKSVLPDVSSLGIYCFDISAGKNLCVEEGSLIYFRSDEPVAKFLVRDGKIYVTPTTEEYSIRYKDKKYRIKSGIEVNPESIFQIAGHKFVINDMREMDKVTAKSMLGKKLVQKTVTARQQKLESFYSEMEEVEKALDEIQAKNHKIHQRIAYRQDRNQYLEQLHEKYASLKAELKKIHAEAESVTQELEELNQVDYDNMLENLSEQESDLNDQHNEIEKKIEELELDLRRRSETQVDKQQSKKEEELSKIEQEEAELLRKLQELEAKKKGIA